MKITNIFFNKLEREELLKEKLEKIEELKAEKIELKNENNMLRRERVDNLKWIYENEEPIHEFEKNGNIIKMYEKVNVVKDIVKVVGWGDVIYYFENTEIPNEEYYEFRKKLEKLKCDKK